MIDQDMEPHPLADELPDMSEKDYEEFRDDIRKNGLKERIVLYEGKILDGRHRARALSELGIPLDEKTTPPI